MTHGELGFLLVQPDMIVMILIRYDCSTSYPDGEGADKDEEVFKIFLLHYLEPCLTLWNLADPFFYPR